MARPKKSKDMTAQVLEMAHGNLSAILETVAPVTKLRIEQAIRRHPDLKDLLEPVKGEIDEMSHLLSRARVEVKTGISLVWKL